MTDRNLLKFIFVEDIDAEVDLAVLELKKEKIRFEYKIVCTKADLLTALSEGKTDLIISDYMMQAFNGLQALEAVKEFDPEIPFILCSGSISDEIVVECIKAGAEDYVLKEHLNKLPLVVKEALEQVIIKKEKRAADLLLKDSEEKLQSIFRAAPVGIGLVVNRVLIEVNDALCSMTGYTRGDLIGKSYEMLYSSTEEYSNEGKDKYLRIAEKGSASVETSFKCKNGEILNVILSSAPLDENDQSKGVTFTILDISSRKLSETALRESEDRYRALFNDAIVGLYRTNANGEILQANKTLLKMLGFQTLEELALTNINTSTVGNNINAKKRRKLIKQIELDGEINDLETIWICKDGREIFVRESAKAVCNSDGIILWYDGTVEDITRSKKIEEALKESRHLFETLALTSPVGIFRTDPDGQTTYVNPKWQELSGLNFNDAMGSGWIKAVHPDDRANLKDIWESDIRTKRNSVAEYRFLRSDGTVIWVMGNAAPEWIENRIIGYVGTITDITDRRNAEEVLRRSEEKYRMIFENVQDLYYETSIAGNILEVSPSIEILSKRQYTRSDLIGKSMYDFFCNPVERETLLNELKDDGFVSDFEITLKNRDGTEIPCSISSKLIFELSGNPEKIIGSVRDITDRKNVSDALRLAKEKAEASDKLKTAFLNNISHEVRTPLNGILGFAEIISQPELSEEDKKESVSMLIESSDRLLNTITNIMDISLLTSGNMSVYKKVFRPDVILRKIFDDYQQICSIRKLELILEIPEQSGSLYLNSDPEIFRKIMSHFLNNAVKFTEKGRIAIGYKADNIDLEFFVKDSGIGIGEYSIDNIFNHFVKGDHGTSTFSEGSGLGLSIAKGMTGILDGIMKVESEVGKGSYFSVTIPFVKDPDIIGHYSADDKGKKIGLIGRSILVAEDDETNFYYINSILSRITGASVIHAFNGREAIELIKTNPGIVLVLMDIKMPEIDGIEATRQIKLLNNKIPVIALTAFAMSGDEDRVLSAGCDGYLSKPINSKSLIEKIGEYINL